MDRRGLVLWLATLPQSTNPNDRPFRDRHAPAWREYSNLHRTFAPPRHSGYHQNHSMRSLVPFTSSLLLLLFATSCRSPHPTDSPPSIPSSRFETFQGVRFEYNIGPRFNLTEKSNLIHFVADCGLKKIDKITLTGPATMVSITVKGKDSIRNRTATFRSLSIIYQKWHEETFGVNGLYTFNGYKRFKSESNGFALLYESQESLTSFKIHHTEFRAHLDPSIPLKLADEILEQFLNGQFDAVRKKEEFRRSETEVTATFPEDLRRDPKIPNRFALGFSNSARVIIYTIERNPTSGALSMIKVSGVILD